ncbi:MAG: glycerol-3-phosphate O-acyltransferase [Myxococcota bacterium]
MSLGSIAVYEFVRFAVISRFRRRFRATAIRFIRRNGIKLEQARFIDRAWMRERIASDPDVDRAVLASAEATGEPISIIRDRVDEYIEEIAPYFSIAMYYRLGANLAKRLVNFCFELVEHPGGFEAQTAAIPEDAVRVYVINHRSMADSVVLSYGLLNRIALSYAVGEWARIWPLNYLFRAFGSYFVRRGEKDPVYHKVLERFLQLLAGHGGVTGFFIEGGLSRDGALRPPKLGLLDYLVKLRRDFPERDIAFLPVGLNYDRVLEDRTLVAERDGPVPKKRLVWRLLGVLGILFWLPVLIFANVVKVATRSHRKFGYAALAFGEPLLLSRWPGGAGLHALDDDARHEGVAELAEEILNRRIGAVIPATPVPVLAMALRRGARTLPDLNQAVGEVLAELRNYNAPIALGVAFADVIERRQAPGLPSVPGSTLDAQLLNHEEAELLTSLALRGLRMRRVVRVREGTVEVMAGEEPVLDYYANSIGHYWAETTSVMTNSDSR